MIYTIKVEYTYKLGLYTPKPLTRTIETKVLFNGEKAFAEAVKRAELYGAKNNYSKTGVKIYLYNNFYTMPVKISDNYIFSNDSEYSTTADALFNRIEKDIFAGAKTDYRWIKWTTLSVLLAACIFGFKQCKTKWDEEVDPYNSKNWKSENYYKEKALGKQIQKDLDAIENGTYKKTVWYNADTCKEDLSWKNLYGDKKEYRRKYLKRILMNQPDLYIDKDGNRLQFPRKDIGLSSYLEAYALGDDELCLFNVEKFASIADKENFVMKHAQTWANCQYERVKLFRYEKRYYVSPKYNYLSNDLCKNYNSDVIVKYKDGYASFYIYYDGHEIVDETLVSVERGPGGNVTPRTEYVRKGPDWHFVCTKKVY